MPVDEDQVKCHGCNNYFHFGCCGLAENTYRRMASSKKEAWRCVNCRTNPRTATSSGNEKKTQILILRQLVYY